METSKTTLISFPLPNQPGELARVTAQLTEANINLTGLYTSEEPEMTTLHLVSGADNATETLSTMGIASTSKEIMAVKIPSQPGMLAQIAKKLGDSGVNIQNIFATEAPDGGNSVIFVEVQDVEAGIAALA